MRVCGFDPSMTNFGWALHDTDGVGLTRCVARGRFQTSSKTLFIDRYRELRESVHRLVEDLGVQYGVTRIGQEFPIFHEMQSEGLYGLFLYTCEALREAKVDVVFFSPMQVKAHARDLLGRPDGWIMQKPDMVEAAKKDTGGRGSWNHNEADAYWVARTAARFWQFFDGVLKESDLTPAEARQFLQVHTFLRGKKKGKVAKTGILYREGERFFQWSKED